MNRDTWERRVSEFPDRIRELSLDNVLVHQIIEMYASGQIITIKEAMCQMVVGLAQDWKAANDRYCRALMNADSFIITPTNPLP